MEPRREHQKRNQRRASILLVSLLLFSIVPAFTSPVLADDSGRDANIMVTISPTAQTVNPGETAEYTIRVRNLGQNPVSVQISSNNDAQNQDCSGYANTEGEIPQPIDAGSYEETFLNVTLGQNAEGSCDTTVTVTANEQVTPPDQPGAPATETSTVQTTAGDGAGSAVFGVDLIVESPNKQWNGESTVEWDVEVENTGRVQETVDLSVDTTGGSGCKQDGSLSISVDPSQVQIDNGSSEWVTVTLQVPEGQSSDKFCWEITGVVTNDQNPNGSASDTEEFSLNVPELKECSLELSKTSMNIIPGETGTLTATFSNEGNTDWNINVNFGGSHSSWASVDGASSGMLPYNGGNGEKEFTIKITPDDSIEAGSQKTINVNGRDGSATKCTTSVSVTVGQSYGASMSLGNAALYNIEPGTNGSTTLTVTNQGNGADTFRITSSAPPSGWAVSLESSTISTQSRHSSSGKSGTIEIQISLPGDALATEEVEITFSVLPNGGGAAYATQTLRVTVQSIHAMSGGAPSDDQTGRSDTTVQFPMTIQNDGNTADRFRFSVISQTAQPGWGKHFETEDGTVITELDINARGSEIVYLVVSIDGEEELEYSRLTVRVTNLGDNNNGDEDGDGVPDNQLEFIFRAILSDRDFAMDAMIMHSPSEFSRDSSLVLPPGGVATYMIKVMNTGDMSDEAIFDFTGLSGTATRSLYFQGMPVEGPISIPKGWGAYNITTGQFYYDGNNPMIANTNDSIFEKMVEKGIQDQYIGMQYFGLVTLEIEVSSGAENGDGGLLEMVVTSVSNAANRSGKISIALSVNTVLSLQMDLDGNFERNVTLGSILESTSRFKVDITNTGNVDTEVMIFSSGGLRGWNVILTHGSADCDNNGDHLICNIEEGETIQITAKVTAPIGKAAEVPDTFVFTLSVEPTDIGLVGRENLELTVNGAPEQFGFNSLMSPNVLFGMAGVILLGVLYLMLRRKTV